MRNEPSEFILIQIQKWMCKDRHAAAAADEPDRFKHIRSFRRIKESASFKQQLIKGIFHAFDISLFKQYSRHMRPVELVGIRAAVEGNGTVTVKRANGTSFTATATLSAREKHLLLCGGLLASLK